MSTKSSFMKAGDTYTVRAGEFKGQSATIVDPAIFPDSDLTRRRKITVDIGTERVYLLPRLLEAPNAQYPNAIPVQPFVTVPHPVSGAPVILPGNITDPDDPRLDPWRPSPSIVKEYISRNVPSGQKDTDFLLSLWEQRTNILLVGDTQAGKTMLVQVLAVLAGLRRPSGKPIPVMTLSGSSGVTDFDLFGQPTTFTSQTGEDRLVWLPGVVDLAARAGCFLYLDEVNMMSERVTSSLHSLTDHRRAFVNRQKAVRFEHEGTEIYMPDIVEAHPEMWVIGTMNPGYKGAGALQEAFTNRFTWIPWGYDDAVEKKLIPSAAIRLMGQALREARANRAISTPIGTAALSRMCAHVETYGVDTAVWMLTAMFTPQEQPKVEAIIKDRSILMLINDEQAAKAGATPPAPPYDPSNPF